MYRHFQLPGLVRKTALFLIGVLAVYGLVVSAQGNNNPVRYFKNYFVTGDYVVAGAGLRGTGDFPRRGRDRVRVWRRHLDRHLTVSVLPPCWISDAKDLELRLQRRFEGRQFASALGLGVLGCLKPPRGDNGVKYGNHESFCPDSADFSSLGDRGR